MKNLPPDLNDRQLRAYKVIHTINMGWTALIVVLSLFAIGFLSFLYSIFWVGGQGTSKTILGGIDGLLGWCVKAIINYLFPAPNAGQPGQGE
jgi:hypothetical protein